MYIWRDPGEYKMYPFWLVSKLRKIPRMPHSVFFPDDVWVVLHFLATTGHPNTRKWWILGFSPMKSSYGVAILPLVSCKPLTGSTLNILHSWMSAWNINVLGSLAWTRREHAIVEMVCHVHSARWFWYCFFGAVSTNCMPALQQYCLNSGDVNWVPASACTCSVFKYP